MDYLLITGTDPSYVNIFCEELILLLNKDLGPRTCSQVLGMRIHYDEKCRYTFDQEVCIVDMLKEHGLEMMHRVRVSII